MAKRSGLSSRFGLASDVNKHRTIASVDGEVGTGKTYFALTGRGPILVQNLDQGLEGVVERFRKDGKEIYEKQYDWTPGDPSESDEDPKHLQDLAKTIREEFEKDYRYALNNGVGTVVFDTESRIWQVYRYAEFGAPNADGGPKDYDALNQRFESNINLAKACDVNLFLVRSMKDKWGAYGPPNKMTGKKSFAKGGREVWGYEHLPGIVFTELTFLYVPEDENAPYKIRFGKCRHNADLQFTTQDLGKDRFTFPQLGTLMIEGSSEEDWA